jgi:FG-GAP-like repeat
VFIDYDNDGWLDIFLLTGTHLEGDPPEATNRLCKNNRDRTFTDVTRRAGLHTAGWASAVCVGDYNNDGFDDLFCTFLGRNRLYRNNGDGTFTDVTKSAGLWTGEPRWGAGCAFLDYNRDGLLDLFVSNYVQFSLEHAPGPGESVNCNWKGVPVECGPRGLRAGRHSLYRNKGDRWQRLAGINVNSRCRLKLLKAVLDSAQCPVELSILRILPAHQGRCFGIWLNLLRNSYSVPACRIHGWPNPYAHPGK